MLTVKQLAKLYGVHPQTVYEWVEARKIPHQRTPTGRIRFDEAELKKWKEQRSVPAVAIGQ